jgi:GTP cyclohydrolase I
VNAQLKPTHDYLIEKEKLLQKQKEEKDILQFQIDNKKILILQREKYIKNAARRENVLQSKAVHRSQQLKKLKSMQKELIILKEIVGFLLCRHHLTQSTALIQINNFLLFHIQLISKRKSMIIKI